MPVQNEKRLRHKKEKKLLWLFWSHEKISQIFLEFFWDLRRNIILVFRAGSKALKLRTFERKSGKRFGIKYPERAL